MARFSSKDDPIEPMMLENVRQSGGAYDWPRHAASRRRIGVGKPPYRE
jgi:hypothetical protein